jgi:hypothetical protein
MTAHNLSSTVTNNTVLPAGNNIKHYEIFRILPGEITLSYATISKKFCK